MKKTWVVGLLCIVMTITLVGYNIYLQKKIILQKTRSDTANLMNLVEMDLVRTFSGLDQIFMGLEQHLTPDLSGRQIDPPEIRRIIDNLVLKNNFLTALMVLDDQGRIMYWNNNFQKPDMSRQDYFYAQKSGYVNGLLFGLPQQSLINPDQWIFGISKAIRNNDHSLKIVLAANVDLAYFDHQYHSMLTDSGVELTISSPQGHVYANIPRHKESLIGQQVTSLVPGEGLAVGNQDQLAMYKNVKNYPLLLTIKNDKSAVLAPWKFNAIRQVVLGLIVSLTLLFMTSRAALYLRQQQETRSEMYQRAGMDPLTQLTSRDRVLDLAKLEIKKAVRKKSSLSVILLDLDHFKAVNAKFGRQSGDHVLKKTADILKECSRESDILSRFGGANFLLLLPDTDLQGAITLARKIHTKLMQINYPHPSGEFQVTASFGVSQWGSDEKEIEATIQRAGVALYEVKKSGRNNIRWMPSGLGDNELADSVVWLHTKERHA